MILLLIQATLATTVTISDDESTDDAHEVVFTTDNTNLESDGTFNYNPSTGMVTATGFTGTLTGNASSATLASTVTIADNESTNETNAVVFLPNGDLDGGDLALESDGTFNYNPSTGTVTTTNVGTGQITFSDQDASPDAVGELLYDNTVAGITDGAMAWYDDDSVRYVVDLSILPVNDNMAIVYDSTAAQFQAKEYVTLTLAELEGYVGDMVTGNTETRIAVTFESGDGTLDFVVDDMNQTLAQVLAVGADGNDVAQTSLGKLEFFDAGLYIDATGDAAMDITSDGTLELHSNDWDISTTGAITDVSGSNSLWTNDEGYITATLTEEEVEDFVGGMLGGTETGITVTYEDGTNDIDFVVALDVTDLDWANDWMIAYSNGDGLQELAFGDDNGKFLQSQGEGALDFVDIADSDVPDALTLSTVSGAVDMGAATSLEIPNDANPTTSAEGAITIDSDDEAIEVYSGDEGESLLISYYGEKCVTVAIPDSLQSEQDVWTLFHANAFKYPHGVEIDAISMSLSANAAYLLILEEWSGDPMTLQNAVDSLETGSEDAYAESLVVNHDTIEAGGYVRMNFPTTDIPEVHVCIYYHAKEGD